MKAAVVERYGPPEVVSGAGPARPGRREGPGRRARPGDDRQLRGRPDPRVPLPARLRGAGPARTRWRGPRRQVLGVVYSGTVESLGAGVTGLAIGDEVAGMTGIGMGAHAELAAVRADRLTTVPAGVSHEDAAAVLFGGSTARHFLDDVVAPGRRVLVNGASGAVGTAAVQVAHLAGAHVTAVCSGRNAELARSLGADEVVDHTRTSVDDLAATYDVVLDAVGNLDRRSGRRLLAPSGVLVLAVGGSRRHRPRPRERPRGRIRGGPRPLRVAARAPRGGGAAAGGRTDAAAGRDRRGPPRRRLRPQGRQPRRHAMTWRAAAAVPGWATSVRSPPTGRASTSSCTPSRRAVPPAPRRLRAASRRPTSRA